MFEIEIYVSFMLHIHIFILLLFVANIIIVVLVSTHYKCNDVDDDYYYGIYSTHIQNKHTHTFTRAHKTCNFIYSRRT